MVTIADIDIYSPATFEHAMPHEMFARLRREAPVYRHGEPDGAGFWALTKYDDIVAVSQDASTFSSAAMGTTINDPPPDGLAMVRMLMLNMDPPRHTAYRKIVATGFTPAIVRTLEPRVREMARRIIDNVAPLGRCDFVTQVAAELPLQVIAELLGVPLEDRHRVFDWSNRLIGFDDPEFSTSVADGQRAAAEMFAYAQQLASERKQHPRDDVISLLMHAEVDGNALTEAEFDAFFILLSVAGNETTRNLISGGMLALIEHPAERRRLLDDPALVRTGVEEMLRWVTPVISFRRTATCETRLRGKRIAAGDKVVMFYPSGNRDEDAFPDAGVFDVSRDPNPHLAFGGGGRHFCLGASLARLEIRVMFEELLRRLPDIELDGAPRRLRSNFINGIKTLPVRYTPA
ncbi:MAG TPA: cytochrome P450 [Dehalococcoidia bacterium]|nr:cytochrome P450 [Dehalococcoidia bacterium]